MHDLLYFLEQQYGKMMTLHHITGSQANVDTGFTKIEEEVLENIKVVYLPPAISRLVAKTLRSGNYSYGDFFDLSTTTLLIATNHLVVNCTQFPVSIDDWFAMGTRKLKVTDVLNLEHMNALQLEVEELEMKESVLDD